MIRADTPHVVDGPFDIADGQQIVVVVGPWAANRQSQPAHIDGVLVLNIRKFPLLST